ncbi:MAG: B12-binding domain-containing radical SAM protein [Deltaproteobacteria bacterium HGW-Deltaproteobacteria-10]|nr:MAG: B12-binding domain-containing radical SAM protein [Deltaproteobacteria bacterium HGW-Deltaproteobacteria-10]
MKILLISANTLKAPYPVYPLGIDYVAGALDPAYDVKIADMNEFASPALLGALIRDFSPDFAGVSIRNIDNTDTISSRDFLSEYKSLVQQIRENSQAKIILGGSGFTIFPREFMQALDADYGVVGEGEKLPLLLQALVKGADVQPLPGVITKETAGIVYQPWGNEIRRHFDPEYSPAKFYLANGGMLNLQTKRGCPFRCSYCTYPHIEGRTMRFFPAEEIARDARKLQDAGAKYIFITDSAFNASYDHSLEVARAFIKSGISIPWGGFFVPTIPPPDYFQLLADAGLSHVEFGTESLSDTMLANLQKPFVGSNVFEAHRLALKAGLYIAHYFLLGGPGESRQTLQETLDNAEELMKSVFFFFCGIRIYPHTALYDVALQEGQIKASQNILQPVFYRSSQITDREIMQTVEERARGRFNWIVGSGENKATRVLPRLYQRGFSGPLWEHLIP